MLNMHIIKQNQIQEKVMTLRHRNIFIGIDLDPLFRTEKNFYVYINHFFKEPKSDRHHKSNHRCTLSSQRSRSQYSDSFIFDIAFQKAKNVSRVCSKFKLPISSQALPILSTDSTAQISHIYCAAFLPGRY